MLVIPAIDIRKGKVVRLQQGRFENTTVYSQSPEDMAARFISEGARRIHVVDLEGALDGKPASRDIIEEMVKEKGARFQVGGGIREPKTIDSYLRIGVSWVVCGTRACLDKGFLKEVLQSFGDSVIVALDASEGFLATDGWTKLTSFRTDELIERVMEYGGREVIYTDISKDGMLSGPNTKEITRLVERFSINIIASGGISGLKDISALRAIESPKMAGVIIGKALMEGKFSLKEAINLC